MGHRATRGVCAPRRAACGVRRVACGVRRAACGGVRRAACGVRRADDEESEGHHQRPRRPLKGAVKNLRVGVLAQDLEDAHDAQQAQQAAYRGQALGDAAQ
eukprot:scaffold27699_cov63-Phaeocystis_antarctica.AAC.2